MAPNTYIKIKNGTTGAIKSIVTGTGGQIPPDGTGSNGYLDLVWRKKRNEVHFCEFVLDYNSPDVALLADKDQIEVVRSDIERGTTEYTSFDGLFRDAVIRFDTASKLYTFTARAYSYEHMLSWRDIDHYAGRTNYTKFTSAKAETILKRLVDTNIGPNATTANGRKVDGRYTGFSVEADSARGNTLSIDISHQNLLDGLKKIVDAAGGDFKVTRTGLTTFRFDWVVPTDRSTGAAAVIFSLENGNMSNPQILQERSKEKTVALIGGEGKDDARIQEVAYGSNFDINTNNIEMWIDARNSGTDTTTLAGIGAIKLASLKYRNVLDYDVIQTDATLVEKHYFLGDKVKARFAGVDTSQYVDELIFAYKNQQETVSVAMKDV